MKNLRAAIGKGTMVTWVNKEGEHVAVPLIKIGKEWRQVGVYLKYGLSQSDPAYGTVLALPHDWKPSKKILQEIRRASNG